MTVTPATAELGAVGATVQLTAEVRDQNGQVMSGATVTWSSSSAAVATVDGSSLVTAVANGTATITATAGGVSGSAAVTVAQEISTVAVTPAADTLVAGDTLRLAAEATDANGHAVAGAEFTWASSDTLVAAVDDAGLVTGIGAGEAEVTATAAGVAGGAALAVAAPAPTTIAVAPDTVALTALGQTAQLAAEVRDQAGRMMAGVPVAWSSADTTVAAVDSAGVVTAAGSGATTITAAAGEASGDAWVTVMQSAGSVVVSPPADTIAPGDTLRLIAEAFDANGHPVEETEFSWASSDTLVAAVDDAGLVRGVAEGRATITAMAGEAQGTSEITVENPGPRVGFTAAVAYALEGEAVVLEVVVDEPPESPIAVRYTTGTDDDPGTADAETGDYGDDNGGSVRIAPGTTGAAVVIRIHDDDDAEPAREIFTVTLNTPDHEAGYVLGPVFSAVVVIEEGVCDRTPNIRDEVLAAVGLDKCSQPDTDDLASIRRLDLKRSSITVEVRSIRGGFLAIAESRRTAALVRS